MNEVADPTAEATGETVGEAKWAALRELERRHPGLDKAAVQFEVVSEGERGLLGVGYAPARVVATIDASGASSMSPPARDPAESELAADVRELVQRITDELGVRCQVTITEDVAEHNQRAFYAHWARLMSAAS